MAIPSNADFNQLTTWLNQNLLLPNSFVPHVDSIPNVKSKGIYFWFMHPDGYKALSNYVTIEPIEPKYTRNIDGVKYDLVYIGTAGTGKKGNSNLADRFEWHIIKPHHTDSNICHGTLSTLRAGLGALLSNDLILPNTESEVNGFMKNYMKVFWIEYPDDNDLIDRDEKILIKVIKPLFNLDYNSNSYVAAINNPTKLYKNRRDKIYKSTKERIGCNKIVKKSSKKIDSKKLNVSIKTTTTDILDKKCTRFRVNVTQSIHTVVRGIPNLPTPCSFICEDSLNPNQVVYPSQNENWRGTGDIYRYFSRPDDNYANNHGYNSNIKWRFIQQEMQILGINEITVTVCP
jgi:hypothetical protein